MKRDWERVTVSIDKRVLVAAKRLSRQLGYTSFSKFVEDVLYGLLVHAEIYSELFKRLSELSEKRYEKTIRKRLRY